MEVLFDEKFRVEVNIFIFKDVNVIDLIVVQYDFQWEIFIVDEDIGQFFLFVVFVDNDRNIIISFGYVFVGFMFI